MESMDTKETPKPSEIKTYRLSDDMTSRRAEAQETEVHDKILMSPADARWLRDALNSADLSDPPGWNAPGGAK